MTDSLDGGTAIVTGGSSGIGEAIARRLAEHGFRVGLVARRKERLEQICDEIQRAVAVAADLAVAGESDRAVAELVAELGPINVLVNSAGLARLSSVVDGDPADWQAMWEINVMGLARMTQSAIPHLADQGGHIVHIGSLSGHRVPPTGGFYAPTKFAVRAHADALRSELRARGNSTRVTCISPGFVDTPLAKEYLQGMSMAVEDLDYSVLQPDAIADAVVHAVTAPQGVEINDVLLRPTGQKT